MRRYQVPLLHFLRQWASVEDAEDLVQDTFVRAYENLHRYRPRWRFSTWLYTIGRRLSINQQRRKRPRADCQALESDRADTSHPGEIVAEEDSRRHLWSLAAKVLTEEQNTTVWLYYVQDMTVRQIAHVVGRSRMAVKTMLFRARKRLLPMLQEMRPDGPGNSRTTTAGTPSRQAATEINHG
ncbi:MAG: hypothetical protein A2V70_15140 [Planctomycetes bacterium RBG_13_63_9]|nr:MAG: hypothetical protein A2V70_15140 [Planctomycetes bacterium RBG_13_63_9]